MDKIKNLLCTYSQAAICYGEYRSKDNLKKEREVRAELLIEIQAVLQAANPQWQSIETAPRDGTPILGIDKNKIFIVSYLRYEWQDLSFVPRILTPLHWMPLPPPPQQ
jgi:hypothetical protein